jgi:nucleotide-binding universal stress UspA family protein
VRVLVATDGSTHADRAVKVAARLAGELRAVEVALINVGQMPPAALISPGVVGHASFASWEQPLDRDSRRILHRGMGAFAGTEPQVARLYRSGDPATEIVRAAREEKADLIVIVARGLDMLGGLILGSVSERVLHAAHCPVLVVR